MTIPVFLNIVRRHKIKLRREFQPHDSSETIFGGQQKSFSFSRAEVDKHEIFEQNAGARKSGTKSERIDWRVVPAMDPVCTGDIQVAQVGPAVDLAVGVNIVGAVEIAAYRDRVLLSRSSVLLKEVKRKENAPPQADTQAALREISEFEVRLSLGSEA